MSRPVRPRVEPHWLSAEQQRVWRAFLMGTAKLFDRLDQELRCYGVDLAEYEILVTLEEQPDRQMRMAELAAAVHSSRSRLTHTVSRLERDGLVERVSCPVDRRGVWARLTDTGLELLVNAAPAHVDSVRTYFVEAADEADYAALGRIFASVVERTSASLTYDRVDHGDSTSHAPRPVEPDGCPSERAAG